jgi:hypothetical protein
MTFTKIKHNSLPALDEATKTDLLLASEGAYGSLTDRGYSAEEVHRLPVCHRLASFIVEYLLGKGYEEVDHELGCSGDVPEHSYVTLKNTDQGSEIIIDPTWQQFLPRGKVIANMPKVLMGTRNSVIEQARRFGVDEPTTHIWQKQGFKMTVEQQKRADLEAQQEADRAYKSGAWERFMAQSH